MLYFLLLIILLQAAAIVYFVRKWLRHRKVMNEKDVRYKELERAKQEATYVSNSIIELNNEIRNEAKMEEFLQQVLTAMALQTGSCVGNWYLAEGDKLVRRASFASLTQDEGEENREIARGEGLTWQYFEQDKVVVLHDFPEDFLTISSGTGYHSATSLLFIPLTSNKRKPGIIELASFKGYTETNLKIVEGVRESVAAKLLTLLADATSDSLHKKSLETGSALNKKEMELKKALEDLRLIRENERLLQEKTEQRLREQMEHQKKLMDKVVKKYEEKEKELEMEIKRLKENN